MEVSFIVPTYNCEQFTLSCVKSLLLQENIGSYEVIVVEDGSFSNLRKSLNSFKRVKYFWKSNGGPASARNLGIRKARGEYLVFIDADCIATKDFASKLLNKIKEKKEYGIVGGMILNKSKSIVSKALHSVEFSNVCDKETKLTSMVPTANLIVRKSDAKKVNFFDESREFYMVEDTVFCREIRVKLKKKVMYAPISKVYHRTTDEFKKLNKFHNQGRGFYTTRQKFRDLSFSGIVKGQFLIPLLPFLICLSVIKNISQPYYKYSKLEDKIMMLPLIIYLYIIYWKGAVRGYWEQIKK